MNKMSLPKFLGLIAFGAVCALVGATTIVRADTSTSTTSTTTSEATTTTLATSVDPSASTTTTQPNCNGQTIDPWATLQNADFSGCSFVNVTFQNFEAYYSSFAGADFHGSSMQSESFQNDSFAGANFAGVNFNNSTFDNVDFSGANLTGADFSNTSVTHCNFRGAILDNANLTAGLFMIDDFTNASMSGITITRTFLNGDTIAGNTGPVFGVPNSLPDHMKLYAGYIEWNTIDGNPPPVLVRAPPTSIP
jgi:uncharacterized protein YjbI with pentapeptide repeats